MTRRPKMRSVKSITVRQFIDEYVYRIDLDADYQREKIWSVKQQRELLDSLLLNIDIPKMYLVKVKRNAQFEYECIDGKQRMTTLLSFFKPDADDQPPLTIIFLDQHYSFKKLREAHPTIAEQLESYELSFCIYETMDEEFVRTIFRRLQLGIRLNSGEHLKSRMGTIRDFIYKEMGSQGPFLRYTGLQDKRFSRQFALAQICINSFAKAKANGDFVRARLEDLSEFFETNEDLDTGDANLVRMRAVLKEMDKSFQADAARISSRAVAVSGYLFAEELYTSGQRKLIPEFASFYLKLLDDIKENMKRIGRYESPANPAVMERFQKYVLQASVEPRSIRRRHEFLQKAFDYYRAAKSKGKILGSK